MQADRPRASSAGIGRGPSALEQFNLEVSVELSASIHMRLEVGQVDQGRDGPSKVGWNVNFVHLFLVRWGSFKIMRSVT